MPTNRERVRRYYAGDHDEWARLDTDVGSFEWATTTRRLGEKLPTPPAAVLDLGGGPGRYAIWLAGQGYEVTLVDLSAEMVSEATRRADDAGVTVDATLGDAVDLSMFSDATFAAALVLGPFYQLIDAEERAQAARELQRVCRPGALIAVSLLNRASGFLDGLANGEIHMFRPGMAPTWDRIFDDGVFEAADDTFVDNYSVWPSDAVAEMEQHGFTTEALVGVEGPLIRFGPALKMAAEDSEVWDFLWKQAFRFEERADFLVLSSHLLWLGRTATRA